MDPHFHDDPDNMDGQEEWGEDDSLDGAGANSLPASVWAHQWSQTSAARQQEKEEMEEEEGLAEKAVVQKDKETRPVYEEEKAGSGRKANAGDSGLRRRLGRLIKTPGPIGSDDEAGGTGGGKPHGGGGDGDAASHKDEEMEDEATSSSFSDLKRGKRFKKLTKMLCNWQVGAVVSGQPASLHVPHSRAMSAMIIRCFKRGP